MLCRKEICPKEERFLFLYGNFRTGSLGIRVKDIRIKNRKMRINKEYHIPCGILVNEFWGLYHDVIKGALRRW